MTTIPRRAEPLGQIVKDRPGAGLARGRRLLHHVQQLLELRRVAAGPDELADFLVERRQPHGIALMQHQKRQRGRRTLGVREFRKRRVRPLVLHALARIEQQVQNEIGFDLELLEVEAVGLAEHLPIDVPQVVARRVLAMLGKLVRKALVRAAVQAGDVAFDDPPGAQLQALQPRERLRVEERADGGNVDGMGE